MGQQPPAMPPGFNPAFHAQTMTQGPANMPPGIAALGSGPNGPNTGGAITGGAVIPAPDSWGDWLKTDAAQSLFGGVTGLAGTAATIGGALNSANDTRDMGNQIQAYLSQLGGDLNTGSQFQGYGVTSGLGDGSVGYNEETGQFQTDLGMLDQYNYAPGDAPQGYVAGMNGMAQQAANSAYGAAQDFATQAGTSIADRQNDIYGDIMATQNPELDRMQAEQQAQEYARGRGGIRGSQYGGTAEDAAMARARAMASNDAAFKSREMANSERGMLGQMAGQFGQYGNQAASAAYLPMQQQMAMMGLGQANSAMQQTGQLTGQDYLAQLGLGGANANINAQHSANQLTGNLYNAMLSNMGGTASGDGSSVSGLLGGVAGGLFGEEGLFSTGPLSDWFG